MFFFQAEDGIRDIGVTGVQTCALPISLRTRKVPSRASVNVAQISETFQIFSIPRFSCTMIEWRKAVPTSQGISEAFSTGSQAQYPPQPSSVYDHSAPSMIPVPRKVHATSRSEERRVGKEC